MYSVLILNQKTADDFYRHYPLFTEALGSEKIGICQWNEHGTDIESALPEIYGLTDGKEDWRAIVVLPAAEGDEEFPSTPENPYDFLINSDENAPLAESPVPVIRLTQMIGGVPAPTVHFASEQVREEGRAVKTIYRPEIDGEEQRVYEQLCEKYHFYGTPPKEIILIAVRVAKDNTSRDFERAWQQNNEVSSSDFWKRNKYPSICRFSVFELDRRGKTQRTEDLFGLWTTVMLIATNDFEANVFQAYRLYKVGTDFNREAMSDIMQTTADRAISAKYCLKQRLERELVDRMQKASKVPHYKVIVPVTLKTPPDTRKSVDVRSFGMVTESYLADTEAWNRMHEESKDGLDLMNVWAERALDRASDGVRDVCSYDKDKVMPLGRYQMEDFQASLEKVNGRIYSLRSSLPDGSVGDKKKMDECSKEIRMKILQRVRSSLAWGCFFFAAFITLASIAPGFVIKSGSSGDTAIKLLALTAAGIALFGVIELIALYIQSLELKGWLVKYNSILNAALLRISENAAKFSDYMSSIASYMRGKDYLTSVERNKLMKTESQHKMQSHISALEKYIADLKVWCFAFHLDIDFEYTEINQRQSLDMELSPYINPIYTFESKATYDIPVNRSGEYVQSPFGFVDRIRIEREELYDDAK